jgi:hypothetical protein
MKPAKKLTQLELVKNYIKQIDEHFSPLEEDRIEYGLHELLGYLARVLDKSQNTPPYGAADSSIGQRRWLQAQAVAKAVHELYFALQAWKS